MSSFDLGKLVAEKEKEIADAETHFKEEVGKLQAAYEKLTTDKAKTIEDVKNSGLGTMKSVINARIKAEKAEKKQEPLGCCCRMPVLPVNVSRRSGRLCRLVVISV